MINIQSEINERTKVEYNEKQLKRIELESQIILNEIEINEDDGVSKVHTNQKNISEKIVDLFVNSRKIIIAMIIALTQAGKTGAMISLIKDYVTKRIILPENIYILTGLSSCDWVEQTIKRFPNRLEARVYHRNKLSDFLEDIKGKKNILIIIDEIQVAAKEKQTLYKTFEEAGFYDKTKLLENDIKIVEFTATPDGLIYDLMDWGDAAIVEKMESGDGYKSCFDLLEEKRVFQHKDLCCIKKTKDKKEALDEEMLEENMNEIKDHLNKFTKPLYHIIRIPKGCKGDRVVENFQQYLNIEEHFYKFDMKSDSQDINKILKEKPEHHTFIFIKEKLRCAKTLSKEYLGIMYERYTPSPDDAVIIQGLIGRGTGYDDNGESIYFTNIESIEKYKKLWDSNFTNKEVRWNSQTTKYKNNNLKSKGTYNQAPKFEDDDSSVSSIESEEEPHIEKFGNDFERARNYVKNTLGNKRGPNKPDKYKNENGFLECKVRNTKKVWSTEEMYKERKCNIKNGAKYGIRYCYGDVNDKETLEYWIIHY